MPALHHGIAFVGLISLAATAAWGQATEGIESALTDLGPGARVGIEARRLPGPGGAEASCRKDADAVLPTASAIKTAIMIELFAEFAGRLGESPPGLDATLKDDHPAVAHFTPKQRGEIRDGLAGATARRIGRVMLGSEDAPNVVYNAASNVAIALLGGPEETTRRIHSRDPEFAAIMVRRYMLTDRAARGDNEATPAALAAVLRRLAARSLPDVDADTMEACRAVLQTADDSARGRRHYKNGSLDSLPVTRVVTGWHERPDAPAIVYVVMLAHDDPDAGDRLQQAAERLARQVVDSLRED
ncbi:hypothetical protein [Paludisphaera sp.]|uniref:hypothetical protein n=1 Tax=Paludisphaera sp. TaxID=2017432 RepID=UPI00301D7FCB